MLVEVLVFGEGPYHFLAFPRAFAVDHGVEGIGPVRGGRRPVVDVGDPLVAGGDLSALFGLFGRDLPRDHGVVRPGRPPVAYARAEAADGAGGLEIPQEGEDFVLARPAGLGYVREGGQAVRQVGLHDAEHGPFLFREFPCHCRFADQRVKERANSSNRRGGRINTIQL